MPTGRVGRDLKLRQSAGVLEAVAVAPGNRPTLGGQEVPVVAGPPALGGGSGDAGMGVELGVAGEARERMRTVGHAPLRVALGREHVRMQRQAEETAQRCERRLRAGDQVLEAQQPLALGGDVGEEGEDVLVADQPPGLALLPGCQRPTGAVVAVDVDGQVHARLLERRDHAAGMAHQVDVQRLVELRLHAPQDVRIQCIGRRLVHQHPLAGPVLQQAVEGLDADAVGRELRQQ